MSIAAHVAIFGVTGLLIYLGVFYGVPRLIGRGVPKIYAFFGFLWGPVVLLLPLAVNLFVELEGGTLSPDSLTARFRLHSIRGSDWLWVGAAVLLTAVSDQALGGVGKYFAKKPFFRPPCYLPAPFNPLQPLQLPPREFFGVTLRGNWKLLAVFIPLHLLAMFSEELMWRGYLLPLQIAVFAEWAWVINGILWAWLVHAVLKWHFIGMLPGMLITPFVAQYTGSTWASFFVHAAPNSLLWLLLVTGVLDLGRTGDDENPGRCTEPR